jgi:hypothetical protein
MTKALRAPANEPAPISLFMATAARALAEGQASEHQQKELLQWLVLKACGKSYPPYFTDPHDTAFALGRHFVADQINGLLTVDLELLRGKKDA